MSRIDGALLSEEEHLQQSVADILTTPIGSRVMRRDYGSNIPFLIDNPISPSLFLALYAATADALRLWEPRLYLQSVSASYEGGHITLLLTGIYVATGETLTLDGVAVS